MFNFPLLKSEFLFQLGYHKTWKFDVKELSCNLVITSKKCHLLTEGLLTLTCCFHPQLFPTCCPPWSLGCRETENMDWQLLTFDTKINTLKTVHYNIKRNFLYREVNSALLYIQQWSILTLATLLSFQRKVDVVFVGIPA